MESTYAARGRDASLSYNMLTELRSRFFRFHLSTLASSIHPKIVTCCRSLQLQTWHDEAGNCLRPCFNSHFGPRSVRDNGDGGDYSSVEI